MVLDGAGWHTSHDLAVPDTIVPLQLPPYSPEFHPASACGSSWASATRPPHASSLRHAPPRRDQRVANAAAAIALAGSVLVVQTGKRFDPAVLIDLRHPPAPSI